MTAHPEVTGRKIASDLTETQGADRALAFTINEFCSLHKLSVPFYYKLRQKGHGPAEIRLGSKVLISAESARAWRKKQTEKAEKAKKASAAKKIPAAETSASAT